MQFIINHVGKFQIVHDADGYTVIERLTCTAIIKDGFGIVRHTGFSHSTPNVIFIRTIEYWRCDVDA
ncbi:hypothetical protein SDC9_148397 [bioreactor metagenome]|uniref:Uncharacterized protein n=1 Tax=bioreactor metagenome TaxID=1076179 RepID=A0A645EGZ4_9ZZZZ